MRQSRWTSLLLSLAIAACGGGGGSSVTPPPPPPPATVDHVAIDNGNITIIVSESRQLQVRALTAANDLVPDAVIGYTSSAPAVATVTSTGVVFGVSPGTSTITATSGTKSATITVTVTLVPIASFTVALQRQIIKTNDTTRVIATLKDASGNLLSGRTITWSSSDPSVALIGPAGIILGLMAGGPVTITGSVEGKTASVTVVVTPPVVASVHILPDSAIISPGDSAQFSVQVLDEFGGIIQNPEVSWASVGGEIAYVTPTGMVHTVQVGQVLILATVNGVTGQSLVRVAPPDVAKFRISVDNKLKYPVAITQNDVIVGQAEPNTITVIERPMTARAVFGWVLIRPNNWGEPLIDVLPEIVNPTGTVSMTVTNVLRDGRTFFTPEVRDLAGAKVLLNFPVRDLAVSCVCAASPLESVSRDYGYWLLTPQSVLEVYQVTDLGLTGTHLVFPVPIGQVDAKSGVWRFNLLIAP